MSISVKERRALERAIDLRVSRAITLFVRVNDGPEYQRILTMDIKAREKIKALLDRLQEPEEKR